jgi:hypothetical protein
MWVGILDEKGRFRSEGRQSSPRRCVLCRGTTASERSAGTAAGEEGRWWGPHCGREGIRTKQNH